MEKQKIQQDVENGGEILTYMQKVGKNEFYQRIFKVTHLPKSYQTKRQSVL
jgi:hypothetical protein